MRGRLLRGAAVLGLVVGMWASPARADLPPVVIPFNSLFDSYAFQVQGTYTPISGSDGCGTHPDAVWTLWYAPGSAGDFLWQSDDGDLAHQRSTAVSVKGTYDPVVGDFDGNGCDDILWYAPGTAADSIWWGEGDGAFTSAPLRIDGRYQPLVGSFDDTPGDDVFWYSPGPGQEHIWSNAGDRTFDTAIGPRVDGTFRAAASGTEILFHQPGTGTDYLWVDPQAGQTAPAASIPLRINGTYEPLPVGVGGWLLYGPGTAPDNLISSVDHTTGALVTVPGTINGDYITGVRSPSRSDLLVWHAPGRAGDSFWAVRPG